jgi:hypothetical protein
MTTETLAQVHAEADTTVHAAEQEAQEAAALVTALEERVRDGDDAVTPEEVASARELGRFARLRAEAAQRKADRAKQAARLTACAELRAEIETAATDTGARFVELLRAAEAAVLAFVTEVDERNTQLKTWRQRMHDLAVPEHRSPLTPPVEHGHLGWDNTASEITAGRRRLRPHDPDRSLAMMLRQLADTYRRANPGQELRLDLHQVAHWIDPYAELAKIDTPTDESANLRFFRGENGAVFTLDREPTEAERPHLVEITRQQAQEAWRQ